MRLALAGSTYSSMALDTALKFFCMAALWAGFWIGNAQMHGAELKTIAILDFDLVDDQRELSPATVEYQRLTAIRNQLQDELAKNHLYRVIDVASAAELIRMALSHYAAQ